EEGAVLQANVKQQFIERFARNFGCWLSAVPGISRYLLPICGRFDRKRRVLRIHFFPRPEGPAQVIRLEIFRGCPVKSAISFARFADPNRNFETFSVIKIGLYAVEFRGIV